MKTITEKELYEQNSLTIERLNKNLTPKDNFNPTRARPESSLVELINWTTEQFCKSPQKNGSYIHNKIVIDGSFLQFCEETSTEIECLLKDSIASWKTDLDTEHFIAQGVFRIKKKGVEFLLCSLFHKGNQNEDEVSFFTLVQNSNYVKYIKFRNDYEEWVKERERSSQEICVVGGEPVSYETDLSWKDIFLPKDLEIEIRTSVEGFLNSEKFYKDNKIPWKRGMIFWGEPGNGKTMAIKIILSEYGFKPVTIQPGHPQPDQLLEEAFDYAESHGPSLLFLEDFPDLIQGANEAHFLQLLDGVKSKEGLLVVATANDLNKVPHNITDRPSRFDRKIKFPSPDKVMTKKFLKDKFKNRLKDKEYDILVKKVTDKNFSFAYLKELYVTSAHIAIADNRQYQNYEDVEKALGLLSKDKGYVQTGFGLSMSKPIDMENLFAEEE